MKEDNKITPKEEFENMLRLFSQLSARLGAYATLEDFKNVKGSLNQATVRTVEASHWLESAYVALFTKKEEVKEEKEEVKAEEKPSENA